MNTTKTETRPEKSVDHLLVTCGLVNEVWYKINGWCRKTLAQVDSVKDINALPAIARSPTFAKKVVDLVYKATLWFP